MRLRAAVVGTALAWALCAAPVPVLAQEPAEPEPVGQIPFLRVFGTFGMSMVPVVYQLYEFDGTLGAWTDYTVTGFGLGPEVQVRIDLDAFLVYADGYYNALSDGVLYEARGGIVFGTLAGGRSTTELTEFGGSEYTPTHRIDTYITHLGKTIPMVYGLMLGAGATRVGDAIVEASGIQPEHRKAGSTLLTLEAGFAVVGGQFEVLAAPTFEVTHGILGIRWHIQYGFPLGSIPLYYHISGAHHFGEADGRPLTFYLTSGLGLGTSLGVSTSD